MQHKEQIKFTKFSSILGKKIQIKKEQKYYGLVLISIFLIQLFWLSQKEQNKTKKERGQYNWGNLGCRSMPEDFNTLIMSFLTFRSVSKVFLGLFFSHSRTIILLAAFPVVWADGSESHQQAVKVMQVNEIAPKVWEEHMWGRVFHCANSTLVECGFFPLKLLLHVIKACANGGWLYIYSR